MVVLVEFFKALFLINLFGIIIHQVDDDYSRIKHQFSSAIMHHHIGIFVQIPCL